MTDVKTRVAIRPFEAARDAQSLRACVIDQQNVHRGIEPSWPDGDAIVSDYVPYLDTECAAHNGRLFMAQCGEQAAGFACVVATTRGEAPKPAPSDPLAAAARLTLFGQPDLLAQRPHA